MTTQNVAAIRRLISHYWRQAERAEEAQLHPGHVEVLEALAEFHARRLAEAEDEARQRETGAST